MTDERIAEIKRWMDASPTALDISIPVVEVRALLAELIQARAEVQNAYALQEELQRVTAGVERERDEARDTLNARGLSCCPDLDLMHWMNKAKAAERERDAARREALLEAARLVEDADVYECGSGYIRADDGRATLVAAADAIREMLP